MKSMTQWSAFILVALNYSANTFFRKVFALFRFGRQQIRALRNFLANLMHLLCFAPQTIRRVGSDSPPVNEHELKEPQIKLWKGNL